MMKKERGKPSVGGKKRPQESKKESEGVRLNRFIAHAGICSRREADRLIETGVIEINGKIVTELGTKVMPGDVVKYDGRVLKGEKLYYVLLNKPRDYITTSKDPQNRKTVLELVKNSCNARIFPVGRLDRNTTGLLLFTNDGDLAKKLTHPKHGVKKIYHVQLDKNVKSADISAIANGVIIEGEKALVDEVSYVQNAKNEVGVMIHSGRNRIVRKIFESLGYRVLKLDRVIFAGLTKKDLPRSRWRHLEKDEVNMLKKIR